MSLVDGYRLRLLSSSVFLLFMVRPSLDVLYARAVMGSVCGQVSEITAISMILPAFSYFFFMKTVTR
jgi:hypothetical protein